MERLAGSPFRGAHPGQSVSNDGAIFSAQRSEIADGTHGGQIEKISQIGFAASGDFLDAMAELKNKSGGAEVDVSAGRLGVNQSRAGRRAVFWFMMIDNDQVHPELG